MTTDQWNKIESIVDTALDCPDDRRDAFVEKECKGDQDLIKHVKSFLSSVSKADQFLSSTYRVKDKLENEAVSSNFKIESYEHFIGSEVGAYTLTSLLGEGGMGAVFLGERTDGQFEHTAAIKIIQNGVNRPEIYSHFLRERQILAGLNHDNIARLYDGGVTDKNTPYLIMEFVDGTPIDEYCTFHTLSAGERIDLFKSVCKAAGYAHKNLVVHRDLKPENILITKNGTVKVMDFGIAKLIDHSNSDEIVDQSRSRYFSFSNASPELVKGDSATTASDIYSLGVLLYKLLAGVHPLPLEQKSGLDVKNLILTKKPASLTKRFQALPPAEKEKILITRTLSQSFVSDFLNDDLNAITQKCLNKSAENRYQTVDDLLQDLDRYEKEFPVQARGSIATYRAAKFTSRNRGPITAVASILMILIISAVFYTYTVQQERDIAQLEANKATQVTQFVLNLFKGSDPSQSGGSNISARELLNRGIERTEYLSNQPEIQANMLEVLGRILTQLGEYDEATNLLQQSINLRKELFGEGNLETVSSYEKMGTLLSAKGSFFKAESMLESALSMREKLQGESQAAMSEAHAELAYVYRRLGKFDKAEEKYRSLIKIYEEKLGPDDPMTLTSLSSLGVTLHTSGKLNEAEAIHREVLAKRLELYNTTHPNIAMSYNNLGSLLLNLGEFEESEKMITKSLEMRRALFSNKHPKVALTLNNLGILKRNLGQFGEAISLVEESMSINRDLLGGDELQTATNLFSLAELYMMTGKYDIAFDYYRQSNRVFTNNLPKESSFIARSLIGMGESRLFKQGADQQSIEQQITDGFHQVKEIHPEESIEFGLASAAMGKLCLQLNQKEQSFSYLNKAHKIISDIEGDSSVRAAAIESLLANNFSHLSPASGN